MHKVEANWTKGYGEDLERSNCGTKKLLSYDRNWKPETIANDNKQHLRQENNT